MSGSEETFWRIQHDFLLCTILFPSFDAFYFVKDSTNGTAKHYDDSALGKSTGDAYSSNPARLAPPAP